MSLHRHFCALLLPKTFEMREESIDRIVKNLSLPEEKQLAMTANQKRIFEYVKKCLAILDEEPMIPTAQLRERLMEAAGIGQTTAYEVILVAREALGNKKPTSKLAVREMILEMAREGYQMIAFIQDPEKKVDAIVKIGNMLARSFATSTDEGERMMLADLLERHDVRISIDVGVIGIHPSEKELKEQERLKREANYEDIDFEELVKTEEEAE